jgi:hypothetical protein
MVFFRLAAAAAFLMFLRAADFCLALAMRFLCRAGRLILNNTTGSRNPLDSLVPLILCGERGAGPSHSRRR